MLIQGENINFVREVEMADPPQITQSQTAGGYIALSNAEQLIYEENSPRLFVTPPTPAPDAAQSCSWPQSISHQIGYYHDYKHISLSSVSAPSTPFISLKVIIHLHAR
ncbi:hypothetical protein ACUXPM_005291 [Ralstonia sp. 151470066-2]